MEAISAADPLGEIKEDPEMAVHKEETPPKQNLHRGLKPRHLSMIGETRSI